MTEDIAAAVRATFGVTPELVPLTGGRSGAQLYTFAAAGKSYVARRPSAAHEIACMTIAAARGVAPQIAYAEPPVLIMEKIDGTSINRGTPRETDPLGRLAATLRVLHGSPAFPPTPGFVAMAHHLDGMLRARGSALPDEVVRTIEKFGALLDGSPRVSCHGDLNPSNILATADHVYLVDWEVAGLSDPFLDLAQLGVWVCRDAAERAALLERYLDRAPTAEERERAQHTRVLALAFYAAAFYLVSAFARVTVEPLPIRLEELFARMAREGLAFAPNEMAQAMVNEMRAEAG